MAQILDFQAAKLEKGKVLLVNQQIDLSSFQEPTVIIKLMYMGICRADVKELTGSRDIPEDRGPLFGHEIIGTVAFSSSNTGFAEGETVSFNPNITPNRTTGYGEYMRVSGDVETLSKAIIKIPANVNVEKSWVPEPFACIVHSYKVFLSNSHKKNLEKIKLAVIGAGCSGTLFGMYGEYLGAEVTFFNRGMERLQFLERQNLCVNSKKNRLDNIQSHANNFDIVVVVPTKIESQILESAHTLVNQNGVIFLYGGTRAEDKYLDGVTNIDEIRRKELHKKVTYNGKSLYLSGAYGCDSQDFDDAIRLYRDEHNSFPLDRLVSEEIDLQEFPKFIEDMAFNNIDHPGKVIVRI